VIAGIAGGAFGSLRTARAFEAAIIDQSGTRDIGEVRWIDRVATLHWIAPDWRPLAITLDLVAANTSTAALRIEADGTPIALLRPPPGRSTHTLRLVRPPARRELLDLRLFNEGEAAVGFARIQVAPLITPAGWIKHAVPGFVLGVLFIAAWFIARIPPSARVDAIPSVGVTRPLLVFAGVAAYLAIWAVVKPVMQSPDEPQHLLRANAILQQPWLTAAAEFPHDPRFVNPIALAPTPALGRLFFNESATLSASDIDALKRSAWLPAEQARALRPYHVALASYPPLYYLTTLALSQPIIAATRASPYQAIFIYRVVTTLLASAAWTLIYVELRRSPTLAAYAGGLVAFLLANPMLAFITSAVNADALAIPLCIGGLAAGWRLLETGTGVWATFIWLLLASLVKPAGLQAIVALAVAAIAIRRWQPDAHISALLITLARAMVSSFVLFYGWSYIHLYATGPTIVTTGSYILTSVLCLGDYWLMYWGCLGWLDYALPTFVYVLLAIPFVWCLREAWRGSWLTRAEQGFWAIVFIAYAATMFAIEYLYMHEAGYFIQGRYFLPASLGLAPLLLHRGRLARGAMVAAVVTINLLLFIVTVQRYYAGDWTLAWAALP